MVDIVTAASRMILSVIVLAVLCCGTAEGEALIDPTRPPILGPQSLLPDGVANASQAQAGVNMVVTAKEGMLALYDGKPLRVGSRIDGGTVTRIASDAIFVRDAKGKIARLPLYPDVEVTRTNLPTDAPKGTQKSTTAAQQATMGTRIQRPGK
ncbi:MAG TPA: hypothetical protein VFW00_01455 [Rhodocyclaceae bacterium]|nr:hypothetical protein [Rhodocyclaceae bacterium]